MEGVLGKGENVAMSSRFQKKYLFFDNFVAIFNNCVVYTTLLSSIFNVSDTDFVEEKRRVFIHLLSIQENRKHLRGCNNMFVAEKKGEKNGLAKKKSGAVKEN